MSSTTNQTELPTSPQIQSHHPSLILLESIKKDDSDDVHTVVSHKEILITPVPEIVYVDNNLLKIIKCLPYEIPKNVESKTLSILNNSWNALPDEDKNQILSIFSTIGGNKQITTRLRLVVNEITKDGRIDMDDLPHITELIIILIDIFSDLKMPSKYDHLIIPSFEFIVMIVIASTLDSPDSLESWSNIIKAALKLVKLQLKSVKCKCCF